MADEMRIGLAGLLRKAQMEHDADFLKEGVRVLSEALMEMEAQEHVGAGTLRAQRGAHRTTQRLPRALLGHEGRNRGAEGAEGKGRWLLPIAFGAQKEGREGLGGRRPGSVRTRRLYPQGG